MNLEALQARRSQLMRENSDESLRNLELVRETEKERMVR